MTGAIETLRNGYTQRDAAARAWKAQGGKVVGYFEDNVPQELIIAAGFLPYRLSGDPQVAPTTLQKYLYPLWKKHGLADRQVKLGFVNSMLDLLFRGRYDFIDYLVIPYSRKSILAVWQQLHEAAKAFPELKLPPMWILDRAVTPYFDSSIFNQQRILDFKSQLETWSAKPIDDAAVSAAIEVVNAQRAAIARLNALRVNGKVSGADALTVIGAGAFMPAREHVDLLNCALADFAAQPQREGARIFLAGSPQDNTQLYALIERLGATVVAENHYWGAPAAYYSVATDIAPVIAIGDMYHRKPPAVVYPLQRAIDEVVQRAVACRADAVIYSIYENDNFEIWAVPDTLDALKAQGIPALYLREQPYLLDESASRTGALRTFLEPIGVTS
jgi:benzoyl-CoA reductase subunit C